VAHLRQAILAGGDAAAHYPAQAAAGFLAQIEDLPDMTAAPFHISERFQSAMELIRKGVRTFTTTSMGRLFDAAAALLGFTRETTFEGQAAMWLEQKARNAPSADAYPFPFVDAELDFRPLLEILAKDRFIGRDANECSRDFQKGVALGVFNAATALCERHDSDTIVLSGGVFQNELLLEDLKSLFGSMPLQIWTNRTVPPNDGGISLGQAALASFAQFDDAESSSWKESVSR
jgi:hydrogenase maturation protein HypF